MYAVILFVAFLENIFPPSPSDVIILACAAVTARQNGSFSIALAMGVAGSTLGFMAMYAIGRWFGRRIIDTGRLKFVDTATVVRVEEWFARYGYWLIVANRFLSGTRAVVSFFAGMSDIRFGVTVFLSAVSSLLWYGILIYAGYSLGIHWNHFTKYLESYSEVVTGAIIVALVIWFFRFRKKPPPEDRNA
jgi:membrane protein DedA with SNARE-associated domain